MASWINLPFENPNCSEEITHARIGLSLIAIAFVVIL
jgi:hypothetical protein